MKKQNKPELLAPAGSFESLKAAVSAGADAVYMGGKKFGARAYADNFDAEELTEALSYAHLHQVPLYLTVNTLLKEREHKNELYEYIAPLYEQGIDAVIVQDIGVLSFLKQNFRDLPIHASTQMSITGRNGIHFLKDLGVKRVVAAREISLAEIRQICGNSDMELECFVHGAICYCYSGQCLLSSLIGGRSGNRGRCAQPCRLPYQVLADGKRTNGGDEAYVLSPKDLNALELLPELIEAGIHSLKIEGRMKKPEYVAGVVRIYRTYLDRYERGKPYAIDHEDVKELQQLYQRSGPGSGYYRQRNGKTMITLGKPGYETGSEALFQRLREQYISQEQKLPVKGALCLKKGSPATLTVEWRDFTCTVCSVEPVDEAIRQPATEQTVRRQMEKTGGTPYVFDPLNIEMEDGLFLPVQVLNQLRREALEELLTEYHAGFQRKAEHIELTCKDENNQDPMKTVRAKGKRKPALYVSVETKGQLEAALRVPEVAGIYLSTGLCGLPSDTGTFFAMAEQCREAGKESYLAMPDVFRMDTAADYQRAVPALCKESETGFLIRNYDSYDWLLENGLLAGRKWVLDAAVYTMNREAAAFWKKRGADRDTVPVELNERELYERGIQESELIVYGYLPVMISAQCLKKTTQSCDKNNAHLYLKDRYGKEFSVICRCTECYNIIYNSTPLMLFDKGKQLEKLNPASIRVQLTKETEKEAMRLIACAVDQEKGEQAKDFLKEFTRGHFTRGIE